jgi:hypothetical protein
MIRDGLGPCIEMHCISIRLLLSFENGKERWISPSLPELLTAASKPGSGKLSTKLQSLSVY